MSAIAPVTSGAENDVPVPVPKLASPVTASTVGLGMSSPGATNSTSPLTGENSARLSGSASPRVDPTAITPGSEAGKLTPNPVFPAAPTMISPASSAACTVSSTVCGRKLDARTN